MWVENCLNFMVGRTKRTKIVDRETERVVLLEYENLFRWIKKEKNLKCGGDREREEPKLIIRRGRTTKLTVCKLFIVEKHTDRTLLLQL